MRQLILGLIAVGTLGLVLGCGSKQADAPSATSASNTSESKKEADKNTPSPLREKLAPPKLEARVEATWDSKLKYYKDTANDASKANTVPSTDCAVAGRIRLFQAEKEKPQEADGTLIVELFDCSPDSGLAEPLRIQSWTFDGLLLKYFRAENVAEPEYTFVLPWNTYRKDVTKVRIDVKFEPKTGTTLNAKSDVLSLDHSEMKEQTEK